MNRSVNWVCIIPRQAIFSFSSPDIVILSLLMRYVANTSSLACTQEWCLKREKIQTHKQTMETAIVHHHPLPSLRRHLLLRAQTRAIVDDRELAGCWINTTSWYRFPIDWKATSQTRRVDRGSHFGGKRKKSVIFRRGKKHTETCWSILQVAWL